MTHSDLLDLVYRFYPRGLTFGGLGYDDTVERHRQREAARRGAAEHPTWKAMIRRLGATDQSVFGSDGVYDPAYSGYVVIPGHTLGFFVSVLGPCYGIRRTGAPGEEPRALELAREIEATYPGYEPIPPELGDQVVPDVTLDGRVFGKATVHDCLLSQDWEWISRPYAGVRSRDYVEPPDDPGAEDEAPHPVADVPVHIHVKHRRG